MRHLGSQRLFAMMAFLFAATAMVAQQAELRVDFKPNKAYILVDGKAYNFLPWKLEPFPGQDVIGVYNHDFTSPAEELSSKRHADPELGNAFAPASDPLPERWRPFKLLEIRDLDSAFLNCRTLEFAGPVNEGIAARYTDAAKHARTALAVLRIPELKLEASVLQRDRAIYPADKIKVAAPSDTSGLRSRAKAGLTLVTCYPFYFIGPAPKRSIVRATLTQTGALPAGHR